MIYTYQLEGDESEIIKANNKENDLYYPGEYRLTPKGEVYLAGIRACKTSDRYKALRTLAMETIKYAELHDITTWTSLSGAIQAVVYSYDKVKMNETTEQE